MCDLMSLSVCHITQNVMKISHRLSTVRFLVIEQGKMLHSMSHKTFRLRYTSPLIGARCRRIDPRTLLVKVYVKSGIRRFKSTGHCAANQCLENALYVGINRCQVPEFLPQELRYSLHIVCRCRHT